MTSRNNLFAFALQIRAGFLTERQQQTFFNRVVVKSRVVLKPYISEEPESVLVSILLNKIIVANKIK
jgi:hypothetical protein